MYDFSLFLYCQKKCSPTNHKWTVFTIMNHLMQRTTLLLRNLIWTRRKLGDVQPGRIEAVWLSPMLLVLFLSYIQPLKVKKKTCTVVCVLLYAEAAGRWHRIKLFLSHFKRSCTLFSHQWGMEERDLLNNILSLLCLDYMIEKW